MDFSALQARAIEIRKVYEAFEKRNYGKSWTREQIAEGLVGDVGDLMKLIQAKAGVRKIENVDAKLAHEFVDCLWSVVVLAQQYGVNLEKEFMLGMDDLEKKLSEVLNSPH